MMEDKMQSIHRDRDLEKPDQSTLDQLLVTMRITASAGAVVLIVLGGILGIQLFSMLYSLVQEPTPIVTSWQQVMDESRLAAAPPPVTSTDDTPVPVVDEGTPAPAAPPAVAAPAAPAAPPAVAASTAVAPVATATPSDDNHKNRRMGVTPGDTPHFVVLADYVMERLETGSYSWLIGVGVLMVFCWYLIKIPGMFITAGTRLLLGLLNVSTDKG